MFLLFTLSGCETYPEISEIYDIIYSNTEIELDIYYTEQYVTIFPMEGNTYDTESASYYYHAEMNAKYLIVHESEIIDFEELVDLDILPDFIMEKIFDNDLSIIRD